MPPPAAESMVQYLPYEREASITRLREYGQVFRSNFLFAFFLTTGCIFYFLPILSIWLSLWTNLLIGFISGLAVASFKVVARARQKRRSAEFLNSELGGLNERLQIVGAVSDLFRDIRLEGDQFEPLVFNATLQTNVQDPTRADFVFCNLAVMNVICPAGFCLMVIRLGEYRNGLIGTVASLFLVVVSSTAALLNLYRLIHRSYLRFTPGRAELIGYPLIATTPRFHLMIDMKKSTVRANLIDHVLTISNAEIGDYHIPLRAHGRDALNVVRAAFRAAMSQEYAPRLSTDEL